MSTSPMQPKDYNPISQTTPAALCPRGEQCEVAKRQRELTIEVANVKDEIHSLSVSVRELITLFDDSKVVFNAIKKTGNFLRWITLTGASIAAIWAAMTHWNPK